MFEAEQAPGSAKILRKCEPGKNPDGKQAFLFAQW
jgi:hypothetical protein